MWRHSNQIIKLHWRWLLRKHWSVERSVLNRGYIVHEDFYSWVSVHISVLDGALWDAWQVRCGMGEIGLLLLLFNRSVQIVVWYLWCWDLFYFILVCICFHVIFVSCDCIMKCIFVWTQVVNKLLLLSFLMILVFMLILICCKGVGLCRGLCIQVDSYKIDGMIYLVDAMHQSTYENDNRQYLSWLF